MPAKTQLVGFNALLNAQPPGTGGVNIALAEQLLFQCAPERAAPGDMFLDNTRPTRSNQFQCAPERAAPGDMRGSASGSRTSSGVCFNALLNAQPPGT